MTAKELRDCKVSCRKIDAILEAKAHLLSVGEKELLVNLNRRLEELIKDGDGKNGEAHSIWNSLFWEYNSNNKPLSKRCAPCWEKVLKWAVENGKVDE